MIATAVVRMPGSTVDLPDAIRVQMIDVLNARLADCLDLGLQARHAHWNVRGANFGSAHELFGRLAEDLDKYADLLAERAVQLGGIAEGLGRSVTTRSGLPSYPFAIEGTEHLRYVAEALGALAPLLRASVSSADALGDAVTADILTETLRGVDKWLWMVDAHRAAR